MAPFVLLSRLTTLALAVTLAGCTAHGSTAGQPYYNGANNTERTALFSKPVSQNEQRSLPALVVTNDPPPDVIYRRGSRDTVLASPDTAYARNLPDFDAQNVETLVTRKVAELNRDLTQLQRNIDGYQDRLRSLQSKSDIEASEYYALVAAINTELQSGTTPGNPVLVERWNVAKDKLNRLSEGTGYLSELSTDLSNEASKAGYLQEAVRATYGLSGAVKADHKRLRETEDGVNQSIVHINRLLTSVSDEIVRRDSYLRTERLNLQTLTLAIANGELYGQSLSNSLFKKAAEDGQEIFKDDTASGNSAVPPSRRPLVIIRFDRPNVPYEQAVYSAVSQALEKYPAAKFDLVAVSPVDGNPAQLALASTEARKNGESVLRALTQMGLPMERIRLNAANSQDVRNSEVHIYIQ